MPKQLKDIFNSPRGEQRKQLRDYVSVACERNDWLIKSETKTHHATQKTWSQFRDALTIDNLVLLAWDIDNCGNKSHQSCIKTIIEGTHKGDAQEIRDGYASGKYPFTNQPLLEGVSAEDLLHIFFDIAEETECHDKDQIVLAVKNSCRIHSSFENIFNSAVEVWADIDVDEIEKDWSNAEAFDKLRDCHNAACAYITGEEKKSAKQTQASGEIQTPTKEQASIVNTIMDNLGLPKIETMIQKVNASTHEMQIKDSKIADLENRIKLSAMSPATPTTTQAQTSNGVDIPKGKMVLKKAYQVFGMSKDKFDFDVTCWDWDAPNPHVPEIDPHYIFRPDELLKFLYALLSNQRAYFHGDTGTGKTTLIEQGAARLSYMFSRINFDSEVSRYDLIGRDVLTSDGTQTISKFVDGKLPQMMQTPTIGCFDEIDFVRPDVAYVMQSALEGNGLVITEDGGRIVKPHPQFRMFATGNTCGQGDEKGMYAGARPQSMALLDRFTVWAKIDYLDAKQRKKLIEKKVPTLDKSHVDIVCQYVIEHLRAFKDAKVLQPISPRGMLALANSISTFTALDPNDTNGAIKRAFATTITDRATSQDYAVLNGIVDRVVK